MNTAESTHPVGLNVGLVGATGLVGEFMIACLEERKFPVRSLRLFASERSAGKQLHWMGAQILVEDAATADYAGLDVVFFSAGSDTSLELIWIGSPRASLPIRTARRWRRCRPSSHCTMLPGCDASSSAPTKPFRAQALRASRSCWAK